MLVQPVLRTKRASRSFWFVHDVLVKKLGCLVRAGVMSHIQLGMVLMVSKTAPARPSFGDLYISKSACLPDRLKSLHDMHVLRLPSRSLFGANRKPPRPVSRSNVEPGAAGVADQRAPFWTGFLGLSGSSLSKPSFRLTSRT